jgi:hypothetical protein
MTQSDPPRAWTGLRDVTPGELFQRTLFHPICIPGKSISLAPTALTTYSQRSTSAHVSPAELYHENSKLWTNQPDLLVCPSAAAAVRTEFARRRSMTFRDDLRLVEVAPSVGPVLEMVRRQLRPAISYSLETRMIVGDQLYVADLASGRARALRGLTPGGIARLNDGVRHDGARSRVGTTAAVLVVIGVFPRNEVLLGRRGYRRTVMEAGQLVESVLIAARRARCAAEQVFEFADRVVDDAFDLDGVEQGTLALVFLGGDDVDGEE